MTVSCPTCRERIDSTDAFYGDTIICPACEGLVPVRPMPSAEVRTAPPRRRTNWFPAVSAVGIISGILLFMFGCCGLFSYAVYDHVTEPDFKSFTDKEGRFSIEFPGKPFRTRPTTFTQVGPISFDCVMLEKALPDEAYVVVWMDLPPERLGVGADVILNDAATGASMYNPAIVSEVSRTRMTCCGCPCYEVVCAVKQSQGKGIFRVLLSGKRMYMVFVGGGFIQPDSTRARYFLDSLDVW